MIFVEGEKHENLKYSIYMEVYMGPFKVHHCLGVWISYNFLPYQLIHLYFHIHLSISARYPTISHEFCIYQDQDEATQCLANHMLFAYD